VALLCGLVLGDEQVDEAGRVVSVLPPGITRAVRTFQREENGELGWMMSDS
jgi:hypothetical protein